MPARAIRPYAHDSAARRQRIDVQRSDDPIRKLYRTRAWNDPNGGTRIQVLKRDPFCKIAKLCVKRLGRPDFSNVVDHIIPADKYIAQNGGDQSYFFDMTNLQGICKADHDAKTAGECGFAGS